jgi:hypothetical protein
LADWLIEEGIAEHRAVRLDGERIVAAKVAWPDELAAGSVVQAILSAKQSGADRGTATVSGGDEVLVDRLPKDAAEGAPLRIEVSRAAIDEQGRRKRARGRASDQPLARPTLAQRLRGEGHAARVVARFPGGDWDELLAEALAGETDFAGGALLFATTPAMTTVDVDGDLPARDLALAAVDPLARALGRFDLGGSVVVDFPSLPAKADRRALDTALAEALGDWPHERTAMNGFGLVQLVARQTGPSLLHRAATARAALLARQLLRRAEAVAHPGALMLTAHPAVHAGLAPEWLAELARRTGREVRTRANPGLALEGGFAQAVPR